MTADTERVRSFYEDVSNLIGAMDPNVEWHEMQGIPYGGVYTSAADVMEHVFKRIGAEWDGFRAAADAILEAEGGRVVALGRYSGTFKATGKDLNCAFAHVIRLRDGRVVEFRQYVDSALWNEAVSPG